MNDSFNPYLDHKKLKPIVIFWYWVTPYYIIPLNQGCKPLKHVIYGLENRIRWKNGEKNPSTPSPSSSKYMSEL